MKVRVSVHHDFRIAAIDDRIYSAFLEHLGRAVYGGIYEPDHPDADEDGFRPDVIDLVRSLKLPYVRYPGGNFVSNYHWEDGVGPKDQRPVRLDYAWRTRETNQVGIDEFARWCAKADTGMMLAVNLGSRGLDAALACLEYCNHPGGTAWSDLRRAHGRQDPYDVRVWCLGNELDGPWQIGHKTAREYGRLANEVGRAMKSFDKSLDLVACGSSHSGMATYPAWEAEVLDECYDTVDFISLHTYWDNFEGDYLNYVAKSVPLERYIQTVAGTIDYIRAKKRSDHKVYISFDEWNVWYHNRKEDQETWPSWDWPVAPPLLEDVYNFEDVLLIGCVLNAFIRRADVVKIACIAQLVNVIAPIMTEQGGSAWRQTLYWPLYYSSLYGRGDALAVAVDGPTYNTKVAEDVPYLDVSAVRNDENTITFFVVNRHPDEALDLDIGIAGLPPRELTEHTTIANDDLRATNTVSAPDRVSPTKGTGIAVEDGAIRGSVPPRSYHVIRVAT
ncbi:alpha-N-arabinofuranosidase [Bauldia sp.]|uniref:arabinosylfuranosidase ArfA n=1 Tax=Bauldia sp. TaxID=2575872 RepID=UPI003BA92F08